MTHNDGIDKDQDKKIGKVIFHEFMHKHTSWNVGGIADRFYLAASIDELANFLSTISADENIVWIGKGSNVLVRDAGIRGTVVSTSEMLNGIEDLGNGKIRAEAGVSLARLANYCTKHGLTGLEFMAGIPGTVGGALAMNAGAFGEETWSFVEQVETVDRSGSINMHGIEEYEVGYRSVTGPDGWFVAATFTLQSTDGVSKVDTRALLEKRNSSQPMTEKTCGSVFRNPANGHAGRLIEESGLKGCCVGDACVSEQHANFIINKGSATAKDIEELIEEVREQVWLDTGTKLELEVQIIGELKAI